MKVVLITLLLISTFSFGAVSYNAYDNPYNPQQQENTFGSTSVMRSQMYQYNSHSIHEVTVYPVGADNPYSSGRSPVIRRSVEPGDSGEGGPGYNPAEPGVPLGDPTLPLVLIILGYLGKKIYDNRTRNICES